MTALAAPRKIFSNKGDILGKLGVKAAASQTFYNGALCSVNATGYLVPGAATAGQRVAGALDLGTAPSVVTDAVDGSTTLPVMWGIFHFAMGATVDAVTQLDLFNDVYLMDDQTIGRLPGSGRPIAGKLMAVEGTKAYVYVSPFTAVPMPGPAAGTAWQGLGSTEAIAAAGAIGVTTHISLLTVTGTTAYTLADGLFKGQIKIITCVAGSGSPVGTVTPVTPSGFATVTVIGAAGDSVMLIWTGAAWVLGPSFGVTFT